MKVWKKTVQVYDKAEEIFLVTTIVVSLLVLFINVILRKIFNSGIHGADEIARICFIWMSWLGISIGQKHGEHVVIDILPNALHGTAKKVCLILADLITMLILAVLVYYGTILTMQFSGGSAVTPMFRIPKVFLFVVVPFSCAMMFLRLVGHIVCVIREQPTSPAQNEGKV